MAEQTHRKKKTKSRQIRYKYNGGQIEGVEEVVKEFEIIKKRIGVLNADSIIEYAKDKHTKLHSLFEWDDSIAGEKWRKYQARVLINQITVEVMEDGIVSDRYPMYESVKIISDDDTFFRTYEKTTDIMASDVLKQQIINVALREVKYWRSKYQSLNKLAPIFEAIEEVEIDVEDKK